MSDPTHDAVPTPETHGERPGQFASPHSRSLTGAWVADDGGLYFMRQIGDALWWVGLSQAGAFYPGLHFCNVYHAKITNQTVAGEWSDVPRGTTANRGHMTLRFVDGTAAEQRLLRDHATGGFSGSTWRRVANAPWPPAFEVADRLRRTLKNVQKGQVLWIGGGNETLAENLSLIRDGASVFGTIKRFGEHTNQAVTVNFPADQGRSYSDFICFNDSTTLGTGGFGDQPDGDVTYYFLIDRDQILQHQLAFFAGVDQHMRAEAEGKWSTPIEGEILMYGRAAPCDDDAKEGSPALFPGWAEPAGSSVLFNGRPIPVVLLPPGIGSNQPNVLSEITFEDSVRVTGAMVFDIGHDERYLEIHPVYSVDRITASFSRDLSGTWADDIGNTYYLRHDLADSSVWYAGVGPLGAATFGQVFRGTLDHAPAQVGQAAAVPRAGSHHLGQTPTVTGDVVAIPLGFGAGPGFASSGAPLGETGPVAFELGRVRIAGRDVPALTAGDFRLMKLYDAPLRRVSV